MPSRKVKSVNAPGRRNGRLPLNLLLNLLNSTNNLSSNPHQNATKFLAIGTFKPHDGGHGKEHMLAEVTATLQLYLEGKIDQFQHQYDGVIFIMTTGSIEETDVSSRHCHWVWLC